MQSDIYKTCSQLEAQGESKASCDIQHKYRLTGGNDEKHYDSWEA